ncbi:MAG TPA: extracellular solute-binding protein, partial [Chloroflexia bacterium]|nr:extracellular solute-binding protein [Chloroflexia bacterium]
MRKTQAKWKVAVLAVIASMLLASCGTDTPAAPTQVSTPGGNATNGTPTTVTEVTGTPEVGGLTGSISFQVFGDPAELAAFQAVVAGFKEAQPAANVEIIHVPEQGDHMTKLSTSFAAGNPPDVWVLNYRRYGQFAAEGVIEPVGPLLEKSTTISEDLYYQEALNAFRYKGTLMCLPQNVSNLVVYYNKDMFTKAGIEFPAKDWTWADFVNTAQRLTTTDAGGQKTYGVGVDPQLIRVAPFIWSNGGEIVDNPEKPTKLAIQEPAAREAIQA